MFFSETLGPLMTPQLAIEARHFLRGKLEGEAEISPERLRELVAEYLYLAGVRATADSVIDYMARHGVITFQAQTETGAARFGVAA